MSGDWLDEHNYTVVGETNGLVINGSGFVTYLLSFLVSLLLLEFWRKNNKHENEVTNTESSGEPVGGMELVPGPPSPYGKFLGSVPLCWPYHETLNIIQGFCRKYGEILVLHGFFTKVVIINSPKLIQRLLKSTSFDHVVKAPIVYDLMKPFICNGVLVSRGKFWQTQRKILLRSMSFQSLRAYVTMLNRHCETFVQRLDTVFKDGQPRTITEEINTSFLEVICEMITGFDMNGSKEGVEFHHNFEKWKETIAYRILNPWFMPNMLWKLAPRAWETRRAVEGLFAFTRRRVAEHRKKLAENNQRNNINNNNEKIKEKEGRLFRSVLDELVDAGVSDDQIVDEINTMLFGGHETGASTIHFFCYMMAHHPEIQEECRREAEEVFNDPIYASCNGRLSYEGVGDLKYIERCLLETLRLYPPVWAFLRCIEAPLTLPLSNGKILKIPNGTNVVVTPYMLHRTAEYFPNPEVFNPDRFLPEEMAARPAFSYVPFSGGSRSCLGIKFGMIEMKMVAAYLLKNFKIRSIDKLGEVPLLPHLTLTPQRNYRFVFEKIAVTTAPSGE